jgi:heme exporter protein A|tara:strand:+ start:316 stop:915 length:600 start_codon:yes stop_codon:yes gene_type:complete
MLPNLKVENLSCVRSNKVVFENINFEVFPGENLEIIGSNGSGKTTLLRTILGLIKPEKGIINWLDENDKFNDFRTFECFYQGHQLGIKNLLTVYENLKLTHGAKGMDENKIYECLERVGLMRINELASNLSVGQRKRISIARWLVKNFKIYFIDEPFSALDDEATSMIEHLIQELNSKGCSFVITGHRPSQVKANRISI